MAHFIDCKRIDISELYKAGMFKKNTTVTIEWSGFFCSLNKEIENKVVLQKIANKDAVEIGYFTFHNDERQRWTYLIKLSQKPSNLGGFRYYFICPLTVNGIPCRKRVSVLYKPDHENYFGCRHCHQIIYSTQLFNPKSSSYTEIKRQIVERKNEELESEIIRPIYRGKKTRKQVRLERLYEEAKKYPSYYYSGIR